MSGHSKWANIRVRKTAQDQKRGKIYTRHARLVEMAARGGPDPAMNPALRTAIDNAKADGVPNANIERAIKKGSGALKGEQMAVETYAAYGPGNVAMVIECLTDNKNRTLGNVRSILERRGGRWTESGSVLWMFQQKGVVIGKKQGLKSSDEMELQLIDAGAEDIEWSTDTVEVTTNPVGWPKVRDLLRAQGCDVPTAGLKFIPAQKVTVSDLVTAQQLMNLIEAVEEDEDVSEIHTNAEIADGIAAQL